MNGEVGGFGEDDEIVQISGHETIEEIVKGVVHKVLESGRSISEAEVHNEELIGAVATTEGCLPFISLGNADQIVSGFEIDLREDFRPRKSIEEFVDPGKRVAVPLGDFVESAIIHTETERSVLLLSENDRRTGWRLRGSNKTFGEVFIDEILDDLEFGFGLLVDRAVRRSGAGFEINSMIVRSSRRELVCELSGEDIGKVGIDGWDMIGKGFGGVGVIVKDIGRDTGLGGDQRLDGRHHDAESEWALFDDRAESGGIDNFDIQLREFDELLTGSRVAKVAIQRNQCRNGGGSKGCQRFLCGEGSHTRLVRCEAGRSDGTF